MKKRIFALATLLTLICSATFAATTNDYVNQKVLAAFTAQFASAKTVSWNKTNTYLKATFTMNDQSMFAYFLESGELVGISRNIKTNQLPINLETSLNDYKVKGWIIELFEFASESNTNYFATIENANEKLLIKSLGDNSWIVYKKIKKN